MKLLLTEKSKLIKKQYKTLLKFFLVMVLYIVCNKAIMGQVVICPENTNIDTSLCGTKLPYSLSEIMEAPYNITIEDAEHFTKVHTTEAFTPVNFGCEREIIIYNDTNFNFVYDSLESIGSCKFLLPSYMDFSNCHIDDWTALKALYESTDGDNWTNNTGWEVVKGSTPPTNCDLSLLHGVTLNTNLDRVSEVNLLSNKLSGTIPPELCYLKNLNSLVLSLNQLIGIIPSELSNLKNLIYLDLSVNGLAKIPPEISILSRLTQLVLYNNQITKAPPQLSNLNNLEYLTLSDNLIKEIPTEFGDFKKLVQLDLHNNQITEIPPQIGNLSNLEGLQLSYNQITEIPPQISKLNKLKYLSFSGNQITEIPTELGKLSNLRLLHLSQNKLTNLPPELDKMNNLVGLYINDNQLNSNIQLTKLCKLNRLVIFNNLIELFPIQLLDLSSLNYLDLSNNQLTNLPTGLDSLRNLSHLRLSNNRLKELPSEIGNLEKLSELTLSSNQLTELPLKIGSLSKLNKLEVSDNQLKSLPTVFSATLSKLYIDKNNLTCKDLQTIIKQNQQIEVFKYDPQYFIPTNYENIVSNVFDNLDTSQSHKIKVEFPFDTIGLTYQWFQNEEAIPGATQTILSLNAIQPKIAGKYRLHAYNPKCLPDNSVFELISDPMYVIVKGYDLFGKPVEYNQIMVQFDNAEETAKYENQILTPNAGWVKKACNCNRELYLWQFPTTEAAIAALLEIDRKKKRIKSKNKPKGGFNNNINLGETTEIPIAYNIVSDAFNQTYPDSVMMFLLDSGLDKVQDKFLLNEASIDSCYNIETAKGYSYVDSTTTVSTNYADELWHGTFGYHSITQNLKDESALKIVPLKIFDKNGKGNLFDMVCAMYHAIDHNADVINISAGYYGEPSDILESAINEAREKGIFITAAAGNDTTNMDNKPQYPAYYAGQYNVFETYDERGDVQLDSVKYDNVISITSIDAQNQLSQFSNFGKQSATIACYGENIHSYGIDGLDVVASGTSMSTFLASKALALEIAKDKQRGYQQIWSDFESNWLIDNPSLVNVTQTSKQINIVVEEATIKGCTNPNDINYFPFATEDDGTCEVTNIEDRVIGFEMYPNPSNGMVQLAFNNHVNLVKQISVIDCLGKSVLAINSSDEIIQVQLDAFAKGIYFVRINIAEKMVIQKLVLK